MKGLTAFGGDGGRITVTGIYADIRGKCEELIQRRNELVKISSGQIRATVSHAEQGVSR